MKHYYFICVFITLDVYFFNTSELQIGDTVTATTMINLSVMMKVELAKGPPSRRFVDEQLWPVTILCLCA